MTLSDVLGRDLRLEWHEAVALMRDIAERLEDDADSVPELHQVELLSVGEVELHGGAPAVDPVQRLGQMLQVLLATCEPPVQLRLLLAQPHSSIAAFSEALGFYERPDRAVVLQELYDRASGAAPVLDADTWNESAIPTAVDVQGIERSENARSAMPRRLFYAGVFLVIGAVGTGFALARRSDGNPALGDAAQLTKRVADGVSGATAAVGSVVSAIGESVGLGGETPKAPAPVEASSRPKSGGGATATNRTPLRTAQKTNPTSAQIPPVNAFDLDSSRRDMASSAEDPESPSPTVAQRVVRSQEGVVYSADSPGVSAPVGIRPQLPKELPSGVRPEDLTRIELTILPDGTVDSVKLIGQPRSIHDSMLLSAAKAWQFHPAMKDGFPVRYRKTIWVVR